MHAIIIGAGKFGSQLLKHMIKDDWDVVIIEKDESLAQEITEKYGVLVLCGDGTRMDLLKEAEIEKADVFVSATGAEEVNILSALLAKDLGVPKVIVRIGNPEYNVILERFKIDYVLLPEITSADYVYDIVIKSPSKDVNHLTIEGGSVMRIKVEESFSIVGKKIKDIRLDEDSARIIGIARDKKTGLILPYIDDKIAENDILYIISREDYLHKISKIIR